MPSFLAFSKLGRNLVAGSLRRSLRLVRRYLLSLDRLQRLNGHGPSLPLPLHLRFA